MHKLFQHKYALPTILIVLIAGLLGLFQLMSDFRKTLIIHQNLQTQAKSIENAPNILARQSHQLELMANQRDELNVQQKQLGDHHAFSKYLENLCQQHKLRLVSLPEEEILDGNGLAQEQFEVEGSLRNLLQLIHQLEYKDRIGRIKAAGLARQYIGVGRNRRSFLIAKLELLRFEKT